MFGNRNHTTPVLLITAAIRPASPQIVALNDPGERLEATVVAIDEWLYRLPNVRIVICDGSGFDFTDVVRQRWPHARIETLSFVNDTELVARRGKGFGEGQTIDFALRNSKLLRHTKWFMKCTAKLWVENITDVLQDWTGRDSFSNLRATSVDGETLQGKVNTRFFIVRRAFYNAHLRDAYLWVNDPRMHFIEHEFGTRLIQRGHPRQFSFATKPRVKGLSGTSGRRDSSHLRG
jgi:hypothetical protein